MRTKNFIRFASKIHTWYFTFLLIHVPVMHQNSSSFYLLKKEFYVLFLFEKLEQNVNLKAVLSWRKRILVQSPSEVMEIKHQKSTISFYLHSK